MTESNISQEIKEIFEGIAIVASGLKRKIGILVIVGVAACGYLAWLLYSLESNWLWNLINCSLVFLPILLLVFVWLTLKNLVEIPDHVTSLTNKDTGIVSSLQSADRKRNNGIRGLISTIRLIRNQEGFAGILESIGGLSLLINPVFLLLVIVSLVLLLLMITLATLIAIF